MPDALEQYKKVCEEMQLAAMIWWLVLWYASDEGKIEIPIEHHWLSCELVAGLFEQATGRNVLYYGEGIEFVMERYRDPREWQQRLNDKLRELEWDRRWTGLLDDSSAEGRVRILLKKFVHYEFQAAHNEKDWVSELRYFHENNMPRTMEQKTFRPSPDMFQKAAYEVFHLFDVDCCRKLGTIMRLYIERDIAYIKKHYLW